MENVSQEIIKTISKCFSVPQDILLTETLKKPFPELRRIYYYLMTVNTNLSLQEIGNTLNQTHATVSISVRKFKLEIRINNEFKELFDIVNQNLPQHLKVYLIN
jgi:chromosomal replication initiation ATPase DnaA